MAPRILTTRDPAAFAGLAEGYLSARPERNLLATILTGARAGIYGREPPLFLAVCGDDGAPLAVMMRTPPMPATATGFDDPALGPPEAVRDATADTARDATAGAVSDTTAEVVVDRWLEHDPELPGVLAEPACARPIAAAWTARTGGTTAVGMREAMHALTAVSDPPRPASGSLRPATTADRGFLLEWELAFITEVHTGPTTNFEARVDRRIANGWQFVWEDDGRPVCTVGCNAVVAGTQRIGPVYTPLEHRNRGYATSATAEASRRLLAAGARRCMLFTDLANPTSNAIYAAIGYRRFAECEEHVFIPATD